MNFSIICIEQGRFLPRLPYREAARRLLGTRYDLEVVLAPSSLMKAINTTYRGKKKSANVLSFALAPESGQLFLDPRVITAEARKLGITAKTHFWNMYLHGILHLKGLSHSPRMEAASRRLSRLCHV